MKNILSIENRPVLEELARGDALLAFDFDGTLAPLVADRACAALRPSTRALLRVVSLLYPCAVISGRARADLLRRIEGIPLFAAVGNQGAEAGHGPLDRGARNTVARWESTLVPALRAIPGIEVERKGFSLAIHYRGAQPRNAVRRVALLAAMQVDSARAVAGRCVVNVVPARAHDKGSALSLVLERAGRKRAVFVGDDTSDEAVFRNERVAVGIRVGRTHRSAAGYYLSAQKDVDELLRGLVRARREADGLDARVEALERLVAASFVTT
jgi:trehalose 6-phosphate phosphatase